MYLNRTLAHSCLIDKVFLTKLFMVTGCTTTPLTILSLSRLEFMKISQRELKYSSNLINIMCMNQHWERRNVTNVLKNVSLVFLGGLKRVFS